MSNITLVLDNLRSCHNVGSILRSANGFGVNSIVFIGTTPYPSLQNDSRLPHIVKKLTAQISKTALGAETGMLMTYYETVDDFLLEKNDKPLYALEQSDTSVALRGIKTSSDIYLVLGGEVLGVSEQILNKSVHIEIPMKGSKESFNVSVAAAIALYELT